MKERRALGPIRNKTKKKAKKKRLLSRAEIDFGNLARGSGGWPSDGPCRWIIANKEVEEKRKKLFGGKDFPRLKVA